MMKLKLTLKFWSNFEFLLIWLKRRYFSVIKFSSKTKKNCLKSWIDDRCCSKHIEIHNRTYLLEFFTGSLITSIWTNIYCKLRIKWTKNQSNFEGEAKCKLHTGVPKFLYSLHVYLKNKNDTSLFCNITFGCSLCNNGIIKN